MGSLTRRTFITGGLAAGLIGISTYAVGIEPRELVITRYALMPPHWPSDLSLKIAVIADIHACEPWMPASRVRAIAELANSLNPDLVLLAGDYSAGHRFVTGPVMPHDWAKALAVLQAPQGVYSVLGNHDWWHGPVQSMPSDDARSTRRALEDVGIKVLENDAVEIAKDGRSFWLAGLGDQMALMRRPHTRSKRGVDDLDGTLRRVTNSAPIILLAHEPFVFPRVPDRVSLTICGHTHGGQVNLPFFGAPMAPTWNHRRYVYGHMVETGRHMIISGGLGTSSLPIRFMRPPEINEITLGGVPA